MFKIAKGTQDIVGSRYVQTKNLLTCIEEEFVSAGGEPLETPVFERADVLLGKYGEEADTKLIYRLADEGGEQLALRYDLTVPFARYVKENGVDKMRRYSIGKVYRRDQPNISSGRYREFIQADFDIYGERQEGVMAEFTALNTVCRVFDKLGLEYTILINDVRNLQYMLQENVCIADWRPVCPIIDKLDKLSFDELVDEFRRIGMTDSQIETLRVSLKESGPCFPATVADYTTLLGYADIFGIGNRLRFTPSLARGLDYYTGFIWEFKLNGIASTVSAGGRYDRLLGAPAVGVSIGVSRLAAYMKLETTAAWRNIYYVTTVGSVSMADKLKVIAHLQRNGYAVQYSLALADRKLGKVITECATAWIRYVVIVGESELKDGYVCIKDMKEKTQVKMLLT